MASCMDCKIDYDEINGQQIGTIRFCRLHRAAPELLRALQMLSNEPLGDYIYQVRNDEMEGWTGPRVINWGEAVQKAAAAIVLATSE